MRVLVTGAAGFIGYHVCERLLARGDDVVGLDNLNDYYDVSLKEARLARLSRHTRFAFVRGDIVDPAAVNRAFDRAPETVVHLAAQAGVRYSVENPGAFVEANLVGFTAIVEGCRHRGCRHLVYASSSSVYGSNAKLPFSASDNVDHPISLYAASKKANELIAHAYSHLYGVPSTGLRIFTAYGPWGRPDMALFLFTRAILQGAKLPVFNEGRMERDLTYIDDIAECVLRILDSPPALDPTWTGGDPATSSAPYRVFNVGNAQPVQLFDYIKAIEKALGRSADIELLPMQPGDIPTTRADVEPLREAIGFRPATPLDEGVSRFVEWYRSYYGV